jgi:alkanesulfonate monooxygenase SsuD/methylene tetrahydromethanopterin reductase-like flavin-dependent oxidoreductase (luciferase family)
MKLCMFHLMPYRDLPADYEQRYNASHIEPIWFDVADADKVGAYYNATLDEMLHAAKAGMHGLCTNQHHQNVYGFMANPSLMGSVLARGTAGQNIAIIQLGSTLPSTTPPTRIAEEYAMLDCISGGRLVAGFPTGLPSDVTLSNGVVPIEQRERYREALALVTKAWSARELFAWNGKYYQLGMVNLWPRPIQQPHPPIWIPGAGVSATAEYVVDHDHCFCHLSYYGLKSAEEVSDRYWETCARKGRDDNPHRYSFLQLIGVAETDAEAERIYGPHAEYFFNKLLYNAPQYQQIPGCLEYEGMRSALRGTIRSSINLRELKAKDFFERGFVVVGSPKNVCEKLLDGVKRLRIGHLLTLLHFGSMPTDVCKANIDLFAREVLPHLAPLWDDKYEDRWWPERLRTKWPAAVAPAMAAAS